MLFSLDLGFSRASGVNMELMDVRQRSASASVSTSASMYRIPPCSSSSLSFAAFVVTLGCCFALILLLFPVRFGFPLPSRWLCVYGL